MEYDIKLNDIADDLLILNKMTVDTLFRLENCADCIALYMFYYKTAKWQKTNTIKANDLYVRKSLKWGSEKVKNIKNILKEHGLINIIQRRKNGKIEGWYIEVSYLVTQKRTDEIKIKVVEESNNTYIGVIEGKNSQSNNTQNQEVEKATSGEQEINALKEKIKCLNNKIKLLKDNKKNNISSQAADEFSSSREMNILKNEFEDLWSMYPKKRGKKEAFEIYCKYRKATDETYITKDDVEDGIEGYNRYIKAYGIEDKYIKYGSTFFKERSWEDDYIVENNKISFMDWFESYDQNLHEIQEII